MNITTEQPEDAADIESLLDVAFGSERKGKTVYRLREGVPPIAELGGVIREDAKLRGSLRFWPVVLGPTRVPALLLGPVAVAPADRGQGYARALIWRGLERARVLGYRSVLLVGDEPYYRQFGFVRRLATSLTLPGPVDPERFLALELTPGGLRGVSGMVQRINPGEAQPLVRPDWRLSASAA
jgi:predicted N-acetyltransferase YhbS